MLLRCKQHYLFRNPNTPMASGSLGVPTWPEFTSTEERFLELNDADRINVIQTPDRQRIDKVISAILSARKQQTDTETFTGTVNIVTHLSPTSR